MLPSSGASLKAARRLPFPPEPVTLGDHLRKRRHELGLYQKEAAAQLEVNQWTLIGWEQDRKEPMIWLWPRVIKFLGYYPFPEPQSLSERLRAARRPPLPLGICHRKAARLLSVDEGTYLYWEQGRRRPSQEHQARIEDFLAEAPGSVPFVPMHARGG